MEFQKIVNLFDAAFDDQDLLRFVNKKWVEVYDQSGGSYNVNKEIRIETSMLRSDLCDFSDTYIVVKGVIVVTDRDNVKRNKSVAFKNNAPMHLSTAFQKSMAKKIDDAEDLDVVMPMYNLL